MTRMAIGFGITLAALASQAGAAALPFRGFPPTRKPNPAVAALRNYTATIRTNLGAMTLDLEGDAAPNAVQTFIALAQRGAYDGMPIRAIFKGKMLVAGKPAGAKAEAEQTIPHETSFLPAAAGAVAMDRTPGGPNTPGRLLILLSEQSQLEEDYTVFARIDEGLDVARRIGDAATRTVDGCPTPIEDVVIERIDVTRKPAPSATQTKE